MQKRIIFSMKNGDKLITDSQISVDDLCARMTEHKAISFIPESGEGRTLTIMSSEISRFTTEPLKADL